MSWIESVKRLKEDWNHHECDLRHGMRCVWASTLASQYYCEQKVEMEHTVGRIRTEAKIDGDALHNKLLEMKKTTLESIIEGIQTREVYAATFLLMANIDNIPLAGRPDVVVFLRSSPAFVLELKTTVGDVSRIWRDQVVQAQIYGLLLDRTGFDCSHLRLVIARLRRDRPVCERGKNEFLEQIVSTLLKGVDNKLERQHHGNLKIHNFNYDRQEATDVVTWAKDYWLRRRNAIPTRKPVKCKACEFHEICPSSLWNTSKPNSDFQRTAS
jgi:hypothetical protein